MAFNVQKMPFWYTNFQKSPYRGRRHPTPFLRLGTLLPPPPPPGENSGYTTITGIAKGAQDTILGLENRRRESWTPGSPGQCFYTCWGTENSQMVLNQENIEGAQPFQNHNHTQQPLQPQTCVQEHCPGETGLPSSVFQAIHETSLVLLFKILNLLILVGLSGRKQCS